MCVWVGVREDVSDEDGVSDECVGFAKSDTNADDGWLAPIVDVAAAGALDVAICVSVFSV